METLLGGPGWCWLCLWLMLCKAWTMGREAAQEPAPESRWRQAWQGAKRVARLVGWCLLIVLQIQALKFFCGIAVALLEN